MVDVPFRQPNWLGSIFSFTSSISQDTTKSSKTLDRHDVSDIGTGRRQADKARQDLHRIFNELELKVTAEIINHLMNFLDVTFNLKEENYHPYRKPNNNPLYIDSRSNHPPNIIKQLPKSINSRLSSLSSDEKSFKTSAPLH